MKVRILDGSHLAAETLVPLHRGLVQECAEATGAGLAPDWEEQSRAYLYGALAASREAAVVRLAMVNGQPVGLAIGWIRVAGPEALLAGGPVLQITDLYVEPAHRHVGIGRRLVESVMRAGRQQRASAVQMLVPAASHAVAIGRRLGLAAGPELLLMRGPLAGGPRQSTSADGP